MFFMRLVVVLVATAGLVPAQVGVVVGPETAPIGCPFVIAISNDTNQTMWIGSPCPFNVKDATGAYVYAPPCVAVLVPIAPGDTFVTTWNQIESYWGNPVPPGNYVIELPAYGISKPVTIAGNGAALASRGVPRIGTNRSLQFCAPTEAGRLYLGAASAAPALGIPTCGGVIPLSIDALLFASLIQPNATFQNFTGVLDSAGTSILPSLNIPNDPNLVGIQVAVAFVTFDPGLACPIRQISMPATVTIQ